MPPFSIINMVSSRRATRSRNNSLNEIWERDSIESIEEEYFRPSTMLDNRQPSRKRGSSFFGKRTKSEETLSHSRSSSRQSEMTVTDKESPFVTLASKIKSQRMTMARKPSGYSLSGTIAEEQITAETPIMVRPKLSHAKSVPSLHALNVAAAQGTAAQGTAQDSRVFHHGRLISSPYKFRQLAHGDAANFIDLKKSGPETENWDGVLGRSRSYTSASRPTLRTADLPMPSPSIASTYSPVDSMVELASSRSVESLGTILHPRLSPPPRKSSKAAFTGYKPAPEQLSIEERDCLSLLPEPPQLPSLRKSLFVKSPLLESSHLTEDDIRPPSTHSSQHQFFVTPPQTPLKERPATSGFEKSFHSQAQMYSPNIALNNRLIVPQQQRPLSQISDTLGLSLEDAPCGLSHRTSKQAVQRCQTPTKAEVTEAKLSSWEDDIDWTYDNDDAPIDEGLDAEDFEEFLNSFPMPGGGSKSAPVSAFPSSLDLAAMAPEQDVPLLSRVSDGDLHYPISDAIPEEPQTHTIGLAIGGYGDFEIPPPRHRKQMSSISYLPRRALATHASLPDLKTRRNYHRRESSLHLSSGENLARHSGLREVAIPPLSYINSPTRSRSASSATCVTLVSDTDTASEYTTPAHSNHNSAEGAFLMKHASNFSKEQGMLAPPLVFGVDGFGSNTPPISEDEPFTFF